MVCVRGSKHRLLMFLSSQLSCTISLFTVSRCRFNPIKIKLRQGGSRFSLFSSLSLTIFSNHRRPPFYFFCLHGDILFFSRQKIGRAETGGTLTLDRSDQCTWWRHRVKCLSCHRPSESDERPSCLFSYTLLSFLEINFCCRALSQQLELNNW